MKLYFKKTGEGKPLIILHGLFGLSDNWMTLARQFAEQDFCCYTADLRNHGRSPHSDEFNYTVMAQDVDELMTDENISSADLIGHSMGGKTAMFTAITYPDKIDHLVVADITPKYYPPQNQRELIALHSVDLNTVQSRKEAEEQLRLSLRDEATIQFLLKNLHRVEGEEANDSAVKKKLGWRFNLSAIEKNITSVGEALPGNATFNKPTLFLRGEKSGYVTTDDIPLIKKHFPLAQVKTIPSAGHWVHAENPTVFLKYSLQFLES